MSSLSFSNLWRSLYTNSRSPNYIGLSTHTHSKSVLSKHKCTILIFVAILQIIFISWLTVHYQQQNSAGITFTAISSPDDLLLESESDSISTSPPQPIDIVITWAGVRAHDDNARERDNKELQHCLRAIDTNLPWFHHVFIVVNEETKEDILNGDTFINKNKILHNNISIITHSQIFNNKEDVIEQHNSDAIEANMHHIPSLSNYFIYFNDDVFVGRPLSHKFFFSSNMIPRMHYLAFIDLFKYNRFMDTFPCLGDNKYYDYSLNINQIPYKNKDSMLSQWPDHGARPYRKEDLVIFEEKFHDLFQFLSSKTQRFLNCKGKGVSLQKMFFARIVHQDGTLPLALDVFYVKYWDYLKSFIQGKHHGFRYKYNYWRSASIDQHIKWMKYNKPMTFCINDGSAFNRAERSRLQTFLAQQFPNPSRWE